MSVRPQTHDMSICIMPSSLSTSRNRWTDVLSVVRSVGVASGMERSTLLPLHPLPLARNFSTAYSVDMVHEYAIVLPPYRSHHYCIDVCERDDNITIWRTFVFRGTQLFRYSSRETSQGFGTKAHTRGEWYGMSIHAVLYVFRWFIFKV